MPQSAGNDAKDLAPVARAFEGDHEQPRPLQSHSIPGFWRLAQS